MSLPGAAEPHQRRRWLHPAVASMVLAATLGAAATAMAHDTRPGVVAIHEIAPAHYRVSVVPALSAGGAPAFVAPERPEGCAGSADVWSCPGGPPTDLRFARGGRALAAVVVTLTELDGSHWNGLLRPARDRLDLEEDAVGHGRAARGGWSFVWLGLEHVLVGWDHVLMVAGLFLVAAGWRSLLLAVTGFTAGHTLSVSAAALGWVGSSPAATELVIALSLVALGREAYRAPGRARVAPFVALAALFGVVHGFGFGGALVAVGLPTDGAAIALLGFNVGVELAQLLVLGALVSLLWLVGRAGLEARAAAATALAAVIGIAGAYWAIERALRWWAVVA